MAETTQDKPRQYRRSFAMAGRALMLSAGSLIGEYTCHRGFYFRGWSGNGDFTDVLSHIDNVWNSSMVVSTAAIGATLAFNRLELTRMQARKAIALGSIALGAGLAANAVAETPAITYSCVVEEIAPSIYHSTSDWRDEVYGDTASLVSAALLTEAMVGRRKHRLDIPPTSDTPSSLPPGSDEVTAAIHVIPPPEEPRA